MVGETAFLPVYALSATAEFYTSAHLANWSQAHHPDINTAFSNTSKAIDPINIDPKQFRVSAIFNPNLDRTLASLGGAGAKGGPGSIAPTNLKGHRGGGRGVKLVEFTREYIPDYYRWISGEEYRRYRPESNKSIEDLEKELRSGKYAVGSDKGFYIVLAEEAGPVGWVDYFRPKVGHDTFEIGIVLGDPRHRGRGIGTSALTLLMDILFNQHNAVRIQAHILVNNERSLRLFQKLGFQKEGLLKGAFKVGEDRVDMFILGILKENWNK